MPRFNPFDRVTVGLDIKYLTTKPTTDITTGSPTAIPAETADVTVEADPSKVIEATHATGLTPKESEDKGLSFGTKVGIVAAAVLGVVLVSTAS